MPERTSLCALDCRDEPLGASWRRVVQTDDVTQHGGGRCGWTMRYEQLSGGSFLGLIELVQLPGVRLVREVTNRAVRQYGSLGTGQLAMAVMAGISGNGASLNGQRVDCHGLMVGRGDDIDLYRPPNVELVGLVADMSLVEPWRQSAWAERPAPWLDQQVVVWTQAGTSERLHQQLTSVLQEVARTPAVLENHAAVLRLRDSLLSEWLAALPGDVEIAGLRAAAMRRTFVSRARDVILSQPGISYSMPELCHRIGASQRKLGYCFQCVLGTSPARYLKLLRLNAAHLDLREAADPSLGVHEIAARWGFWHLGQFATDYKRHFAQLPSETLRRSRPRDASQRL
jgi:AraC family transcriptional regulator, ethanolamine operon transcriptional activator